MRLFLLISFILFSVTLDSLSQDTHEIEVKRVPPDDSNICLSECQECGQVRFTTSIPGLKFESNMDYIISTNEDIVSTTGDSRRIYTVVALAKHTQVITISGDNFVPENVTIDSLKSGRCQDFLINELKVKKRFASFYLNSKPENATITIQGEPEFKKVTPYTIEDHASGVYQLTFSKEGFYPLENSITIPEDGQPELTVSLIPIIDEDEDEVRKKIRGPIIIIDRHFYQDNIKLGRKTVKKIVEVYPSAYQEVRSGSRRRTWGFVLAGYGGISLGAGIGTLTTGETSEPLDPVTGETYEEANPAALIIIGVASIAGGFLLIRSGAKKFVTGVEIYNSNLSSGASLDGIVIDFGLADHGIGFTATF